MISSCEECKTKCCKSGPGPFRDVSANDWLYQKQKGSKRYNTKCENFDLETEQCTVWPNAPFVCRVFVCGVRLYSRAELRRIDKLLEQGGVK